MYEFHQRTGSLVLLSRDNTFAQRVNAAQEFNNGLVLTATPLDDDYLFEVKIERKIRTWSGNLEIGVTTLRPDDLPIPCSATELPNGTWVMSGSVILKNGVVLVEEYGMSLDGLGEGDRVGVMRNRLGELHIFINGIDQGVAVSNVPSSVYAVVDLYGKCASVSIVDNGGRTTQAEPAPMASDSSFCLSPTEARIPESAMEDLLTRSIENAIETAFMRTLLGCISRNAEVLEESSDLDHHFNDSVDQDLFEQPTRSIGYLHLVDREESNAGINFADQDTEDAYSSSVAYGTDGTRPADANNDSLAFHERCDSTIIKLSNGNRTAERRRPMDDYRNGVLLTNRPLQSSEMFEIELDAVVDKWSGSIEIGVTSVNPNRTGDTQPSQIGSNLSQGTVMLSGRGILINGRGIQREYTTCTLDQLKVGDRIGLRRMRSGDLHFYLNGVDQGCAARGLPSSMYGVVNLYGIAAKVTIILSTSNRVSAGRIDMDGSPSCSARVKPRRPFLFSRQHCGDRTAISADGRTAMRKDETEEFDRGIAITNRPLADGEMFQVRLDRFVDKWAGSMEIGVSALDPALVTEAQGSLSSIRASTWVVSGQGMMQNGIVVDDSYALGISTVKVGDRIGVVRYSDTSLKFFINGVDQGVAARGVPPGVVGVVDLYGQAVQATLVDCSEGAISSDCRMTSTVTLFPAEEPLRFHPRVRGNNVDVSADGCSATRQRPDVEFKNAVVITNRPLRPAEPFVIRIDKIVDRWAGSVEIGVTTESPDLFSVPTALTNLKQNSWILSGQSIIEHGQTQTEFPFVDTDRLLRGDQLGLEVDDEGRLEVLLNGESRGVAATGVPHDVYCVVNVYGRCSEISIVSQQHAASLGTSAVIDVGTGAPSVVGGSTEVPFSTFTAPRKTQEKDNAPLVLTGFPASLSDEIPFIEDSYHEIHAKCHSATIRLEEQGRVARRIEGHRNGLVFSSQPLKAMERFEVTISSLESQWAGCLRIGLTTISPERRISSRPSASGSRRFPPSSILDLVQFGSVWSMVDGDLYCGSEVQLRKYGPSLDGMAIGTRVGVYFDLEGAFHGVIDGVDLGSCHIYCFSQPVTYSPDSNIYAVMELCGNCDAISVLSHSSQKLAANLQSLKTSKPCADSQQSSESHWRFSLECGKNARVSEDGRTVTRLERFDHGLCVSKEPMQNGLEYTIEVCQVNCSWSDGLRLGFLALPKSEDVDPIWAKLVRLRSITNFVDYKANIHFWWENKLVLGNKILSTNSCYNQSDLRPDNSVTVQLLTPPTFGRSSPNPGDILVMRCNGDLVEESPLRGVSCDQSNIYLIADVYGQCEQIKILS